MKLAELHGFTCHNFKKQVARSPLSEKYKCLILETDPTPDYYAQSNFPPNKRDDEMHLYIPVKENINCFQDLVFRETCCFNEDNNANVHITPGQIIFENENYQVIRIRGNEMNYVEKILNDFKEIGFRFLKDQKVKQYESTFYFKKYIEFDEIEEGVYHDKNRPYRYYFAIDKHIDLDTFLKGVKTIKNNCDYHMFDAFLSYTFTGYKVQDFIGIHSEHCDTNRFAELKNNIAEIFNK